MSFSGTEGVELAYEGVEGLGAVKSNLNKLRISARNAVAFKHVGMRADKGIKGGLAFGV